MEGEDCTPSSRSQPWLRQTVPANQRWVRVCGLQGVQLEGMMTRGISRRNRHPVEMAPISTTSAQSTMTLHTGSDVWLLRVAGEWSRRLVGSPATSSSVAAESRDQPPFVDLPKS